MIEFNYRGFLWFLAIALLCTTMMIVVVNAEETGSYVIINETTPTATPTIPMSNATGERIEQGQEVYLGDVVDISGVVGWYNDDKGASYIQYCDGYDCGGYYKPYMLKLPLRTRVPGSESQYRFYINPEIFGNRTGYWYQYDPDDEAGHGNTVAFKVISMYRDVTTTFQNGTVINSTEYSGNTTGMVIKPIFYLPDYRVSDYVLARGDTLTIETGQPAKVWLFGRNSQITDRETYTENITFTHKDTVNLEPGTYSVVIEYAGKNGEFDVRFKDSALQWRDGWNGLQSVPLTGTQPALITDILTNTILKTDDWYQVKKLEVQDPTVTVERVDEIGMGSDYSRYQEYRLEPGMVTLFDVKGYTNAVNGTNIVVTLDESIHNTREMREYTFTTTARQKEHGYLSEYQVYVPIVWDKMGVGMHTITVRNDLGAIMAHDFPVSVMPADSFRPNATLKYSGDRNPWVPTPTPEVVIHKETVVVTQQVPVKIAPSQAEIDAAAQKIVDEQTRNTEMLVVIGAVVIMALAFIGWFAWSIWRAKKK
jgi:hypothetical protein